MNSIARFFKKHIAFFIFLLIITPLAIGVRGYHFGTGDQMIQLPLLYKLRDVSLFVQDDLFPVALSNFTLLYPVILFVTDIVRGNFFHSFFVLFLAANFFLFLAVSLLAKTITTRQKAAIISIGFFVFSLPVGGSATNIVEVALVPRMAGVVLTLFALTALYRQKYLLVFVFAGISFLLHPLSAALLLLLVVPTMFILNPAGHIRVISQGAVVFLAIAVWFVPAFIRNNTTFGTLTPDSSWLHVLQFRNAYAFPLQWSLQSWGYLLLFLAPLLIHLYRQKQANRALSHVDKTSLLLLISAAVVLLLQFIFTSGIPTVVGIQLQLGRVWLVPIIISFVYASGWIAVVLDRLHVSTRMVQITAVVFLLIWVGIKRDALIHQQPVDWVDAQLWASQHTSPQCRFLVNFYSQGFRVHSQRPIVGEFKDGTLSFYSQDFARTWQRTSLFFDPSKSGSYPGNINAIFEHKPFSFIVLHNSLSLDLETVYQNSSYTIYMMPQLQAACQTL